MSQVNSLVALGKNPVRPGRIQGSDCDEALLFSVQLILALEPSSIALDLAAKISRTGYIEGLVSLSK